MRGGWATLLLTLGCTAIVRPVKFACTTDLDCGPQPSGAFEAVCEQEECVLYRRSLRACDGRDNDGDRIIDEGSEHHSEELPSVARYPRSTAPWPDAPTLRFATGAEGAAYAQGAVGVERLRLPPRAASPRADLPTAANEQADMLDAPLSPGCHAALDEPEPRSPTPAPSACPVLGLADAVGGVGWVAFVSARRCPDSAVVGALRVGQLEDGRVTVTGTNPGAGPPRDGGARDAGASDAGGAPDAGPGTGRATGRSTSFRGLAPTCADACADPGACRPQAPTLAVSSSDRALLVSLVGPETSCVAEGPRSVQAIELFAEAGVSARRYVTAANGGAAAPLGDTTTHGTVGVSALADGYLVAFEVGAELELVFQPTAPDPCVVGTSCAATVPMPVAQPLGRVPLPAGEGTRDLSLAVVDSEGGRASAMVVGVRGCGASPAAFGLPLALDVTDRRAPALLGSGEPLLLGDTLPEVAGAPDARPSVRALASGVVTPGYVGATGERADELGTGGFAVSWTDASGALHLRRAWLDGAWLEGGDGGELVLGAAPVLARQAVVYGGGDAEPRIAWYADDAIHDRAFGCPAP